MRILPAFRRGRCNFLLATSVLALGLGCKAGTEPQPGSLAVQLGVALAPSVQAQSGVALPVQPVIQLEDAQGAAVAKAGVAVTASLATTGGTLSGTLQVVSDASGRAAFTNLAIGGVVGSFRLRFDSPGLRSTTTASIQLAAGLPATLVAVTGNLQTSLAGTPVPIAPSVRATDAAGNPVAGITVDFAPSPGGSVEGGSPSTSSLGIAAPTKWTLSSVVGLNTLTATSAAVPGAVVSFTATGTVGTPSALTIVAGDGQSAPLGATTAVPPGVKVTDAAGHPLPGVQVTFAVGLGGGSVTGALPLSDANGVATLGSWTLGVLAGSNTVTASRSGVPTVTLQATAVGFPVQDVSVGTGHSCAITPAGAPYCWGADAAGQLGDGGVADLLVPTAVSGGLTLTAISAGNGHSCGLLAGGDAYCWGSNNAGQLGDGTLLPHPTAVAVTGGVKFSAVFAGSAFSCGLRLDGAALCWGTGSSGQLGDGTLVSKLVPTLVSGGHSFIVLSVGASHACGLEAGGALFCWGSNGNGRLGDGTTTTRNVPTLVLGGLSFTAVSAGAAHTCGIAVPGLGYCWGNGGSGRLGTGGLTDQSIPITLSGGLFYSVISAGGSHSCAITGAHQIVCWGLNSFGQVGDGTLVTRPVPTPVFLSQTFTTVQAGSESSCGRASTGLVYCWGRNDTGAVGDGSLVARTRPVGPVKP